jgi:glycosyltransferase involved in cell wall biosynthesis
MIVSIMHSPLISCIVPVFNGERYLRETLDSILAQTHQPLEIIVVDDGSTDGTAAVANSYGQRIRYLWQPNAGEAKARHSGLSAATGEFIAFLDADDLWHPAKLIRQIARIGERPDIDLCFTCFQNFWIPELADEEQRCQGRALSQVQSAWSISTFLSHRSAFEKFDSFIDDDSWPSGSASMIWYLRAAQRGAVIDVLPEVLMYRRFHAANLSRSNALDTIFPILKEWRDYQRRRQGA